MLDLKELTITDKPLFDAYFNAEDVQTSELTFTNLFVWREYYGFRYAVVEEALVVIACGASEPFALFPIGLQRSENPKLVFGVLIKYFTQRGLSPRIERADQRSLAVLKKLGIPFRSEHDEKNDDYVYLAQELGTLHGRKFDGKRNHINWLLSKHTVEYLPLTCDKIPIADGVITEWFSRRNEMGAPEYYSCHQLLEFFEVLDCTGAFLLVDDIPAAVTFGEMLGGDTAVIHFEKAVRFEDGAYPAINHNFVQHQYGHVTFINREQDLGLSGLRKSKQSWHPIRTVKKYTLYLN